MKKRILVCVGARPNFIKVALLEKSFKKYKDVEYQLLHTGQHFDLKMSDVFFQELGIREPDVFLNVSSGTPMQMIGGIMFEFEKYLLGYQPDIVLVPGDVNSTFACAFTAKRAEIPVAHIESGLRSFDQRMPEEINRILVDAVSDLLFVTEQSGIDNLKNEGKEEKRIKFVGNSMIDTLVSFSEIINRSSIREKLKIDKAPFILITFHRPSNVDDKNRLHAVINVLKQCATLMNVIFPIHPRTLKRLKDFALLPELIDTKNIIITEPLGYVDFMHLVKNSSTVITDSGGIQEETTFLGIPCITVRESTERPITVSTGTNVLASLETEGIIKIVLEQISGRYKKGTVPPLWDGKSSHRIAEEVYNFIG